MIGEEQGEQVSCFAYGSPVFCVCSGILADVAFLIPVMQHSCSLLVPVACKVVFYGCAVGLIHQSARVGIAKSISAGQTAQRRITVVAGEQHCHIRLACLYGLKYFLHILRLFDFIGIDIILFYQVFSHEDGWNAASFDLVRNAIDKPINLICFCNILAIDIFQVCAVFVNQFRHIHDLAGMHILYSCCCICVQKIDFLIAGKHQL